MKVDYWSN